jgi:hypothetical protein
MAQGLDKYGTRVGLNRVQLLELKKAQVLKSDHVEIRETDAQRHRTWPAIETPLTVGLCMHANAEQRASPVVMLYK